MERLTDGLPPTEERTPEQQATWLLAQLLDWHRREDKSIWWRYFEMLEMTDEELLADREPIAGVTYEGVVGQAEAVVHPSIPIPAAGEHRPGRHASWSSRSPARRWAPCMPSTRSRVRWTSSGACGARRSMPTALIPHEYIRAEAQRAALMSLGTWVADQRHRCRMVHGGRPATCCCATHPRVGQAAGAPLLGLGEDDLDAAKRLGSGTRPFGARHPGTAGIGQDVHWRADDRRAGARRAGRSGSRPTATRSSATCWTRSRRRPPRPRPDRPDRAEDRGRTRARPVAHADPIRRAMPASRLPCGGRRSMSPAARRGSGRTRRWPARSMCCSWTRRARSRSPTPWPSRGPRNRWCCWGTRSSWSSPSRAAIRPAPTRLRCSTCWATDQTIAESSLACSWSGPGGSTRTSAVHVGDVL